MQPLKLLNNLVTAITAYENTIKETGKDEPLTPELEAYWKARDEAKEYIETISRTDDDMAKPSKSYHYKAENSNSFIE